MTEDGFTSTQIVEKLHQLDCELALGISVSDACEKLQIPEDLLSEWRRKYGLNQNGQALLPVIYDRLRSFAKLRFRQNDSLFGTELVHEAYLRVANKEWESESQLFGAIRNAMRNSIVDHIRKKQAVKHGGDRQQVNFDYMELETPSLLPEIVELSDALDELAKHDERAANVVTLRFFACMTEEETAQELGVSRKTVTRDWSYAKLWLQRQMER